MELKLQPIHLIPARERVASVLRDAILGHKFEQGAALTQDQVANQLGVSKTPVREAFQILERDGLIHLTPNRGAIVLGITKEDIVERYKARAVLEVECVRNVCENGADISAIIRFNQRMFDIAQSGDTSDNSLLNQQFHMGIWAASGNRFICDLLTRISSGFNLDWTAQPVPGVRRAATEHDAVVRALIKRDADRAADAMRAHVLSSMELFVSYY